MKLIIGLIMGFFLSACTPKYDQVVPSMDRDKFMGDWYVMAGRFTPLEKDVYNAIETYSWNEKENRIDINFRFNHGSLNGELKKYSQKAWFIGNQNTRWKVQPFWPLKFDYLVLELDSEYRWTAIGVPDQKYLWIMSKDPKFSKDEIQNVVNILKNKGYDTSDIVYVPHQH